MKRPAQGRSAAPPAFRAQLATLVERAPDGEAWLHETKYDGYRIGCRIEQGRVKLESRSGQDWTERFPEVARAASALPVKSALLDGEVAVVLPDGKTSFQALQNAARGGRAGKLTYFVFDLLFLDGQELAALPLSQRKARLEALLGAAKAGTATLRYARHVVGGGPEVLAKACALGMEGIVSKRCDRPYQPGRNLNWLKSKCTKRQEFVVGGFTEPEGARQGFGALLLGYYAGAALRFAGKVGNGPGFTASYTSRLRRELDALEQSACPFSPRPPSTLGRGVHWVEPVRVAEVSFTEWTEGGAVRHPLLLGFRSDKSAREVRREAPRASNAARGAAAAKPAAKVKRARASKARARR